MIALCWAVPVTVTEFFVWSMVAVKVAGSPPPRLSVPACCAAWVTMARVEVVTTDSLLAPDRAAASTAACRRPCSLEIAIISMAPVPASITGIAASDTIRVTLPPRLRAQLVKKTPIITLPEPSLTLALSF